MAAPKWAVNAANRFKIPVKWRVTNGVSSSECDFESLHKRLVAMQMKAYRRGVKDAINGRANIPKIAHLVDIGFNRGKTAEDKK
jgi:hypothetical protein